jgi:hypothetical protein
MYGCRHRSGEKVQYFLGFMAAAGTGVIPCIGNWNDKDDAALSGRSGPDVKGRCIVNLIDKRVKRILQAFSN